MYLSCDTKKFHDNESTHLLHNFWTSTHRGEASPLAAPLLVCIPGGAHRRHVERRSSVAEHRIAFLYTASLQRHYHVRLLLLLLLLIPAFFDYCGTSPFLTRWMPLLLIIIIIYLLRPKAAQHNITITKTEETHRKLKTEIHKIRNNKANHTANLLKPCLIHAGLDLADGRPGPSWIKVGPS